MRYVFSQRFTVLKTLGLAGAALFAGLVFAPEAGAQTLASLPSVPSAITSGASARPIAAWVDFCQSYAAECAVNTAEAAQINLTPAIWATIVSVNRRVNKSLRAVTDMDHLHVADRWDLAEDGAGDCEDFQLLKRKLLAEAGLPRRAMRMTVVIDEKGEGHAVLTLVTDRGPGARPAIPSSSARARTRSAGSPWAAPSRRSPPRTAETASRRFQAETAPRTRRRHPAKASRNGIADKSNLQDRLIVAA
jgi:predicted transglutaminase-like cysteine proteinase